MNIAVGWKHCFILHCTQVLRTSCVSPITLDVMRMETWCGWCGWSTMVYGSWGTVPLYGAVPTELPVSTSGDKRGRYSLDQAPTETTSVVHDFFITVHLSNYSPTSVVMLYSSWCTVILLRPSSIGHTHFMVYIQFSTRPSRSGHVVQCS